LGGTGGKGGKGGKGGGVAGATGGVGERGERGGDGGTAGAREAREARDGGGEGAEGTVTGGKKRGQFGSSKGPARTVDDTDLKPDDKERATFGHLFMYTDMYQQMHPARDMGTYRKCEKPAAFSAVNTTVVCYNALHNVRHLPPTTPRLLSLDLRARALVQYLLGVRQVRESARNWPRSGPCCASTLRSFPRLAPTHLSTLTH